MGLDKYSSIENVTNQEAQDATKKIEEIVNDDAKTEEVKAETEKTE